MEARIIKNHLIGASGVLFFHINGNWKIFMEEVTPKVCQTMRTVLKVKGEDWDI